MPPRLLLVKWQNAERMQTMTTQIKDGKVSLGEAVLRAAKLSEGDEVEVYVDDDGRVIAERRRVYQSGEAFLADLKRDHERLLSEGR